MRGKGFIKNIVIITVFLVAVFLSQQNDIYTRIKPQISPYFTKAGNWLMTNIYSKIGPEIEKRGEAVKQEAEKQKAGAIKNIWENFKNYLAEKFFKATGTKVE